MAEIHPEVQALLSPLLESPLASFGQRAIERIEADDIPVAPEDRIEGETGARDDSMRGRGLRQMEHLHQAVTVPLKRELAICDQLSELASQFGIDSIDVVANVVDGLASPSATDHLLAPKRRDAIMEFLDVWFQLWGETRNTIETQADG